MVCLLAWQGGSPWGSNYSKALVWRVPVCVSVVELGCAGLLRAKRSTWQAATQKAASVNVLDKIVIMIMIICFSSCGPGAAKTAPCPFCFLAVLSGHLHFDSYGWKLWLPWLLTLESCWGLPAVLCPWSEFKVDPPVPPTPRRPCIFHVGSWNKYQTGSHHQVNVCMPVNQCLWNDKSTDLSLFRLFCSLVCGNRPAIF